jgi:hypothetical protein
VVVTVVLVRMMKPSGDEVIGVVAVRNRLVAAAVAVRVVGAVPVGGCDVAAGVLGVDLDDVLVDMVAVRVMKVPVVEVVDVIAMLDGGVATAGAVDVRMLAMNRVIGHAPDSAGWGAHLQAGESEKRSWPDGASARRGDTPGLTD